ALDDCETFRDACVHALARNLDAAAVDALGFDEQPQEFAVAGADVEHARAGLHHLGDQHMVDSPGGGFVVAAQHGQPFAGGRPRARAAASMKPRVMAKSSGSSSRKASWPLSLSISA